MSTMYTAPALPAAPAESTSHPAPEVGTVLSGAEILVASLERVGVEVIFAYPGGASMPIHQALTRSRKIRTILPRHEQGGVFAAEGFARATGRAGVCMATSGPGATNLISGIADAYMDSIPLVAITGQVPQDMIGKGAFQETDVFGMTLPIVKHSYLVWDIHDIPRIVKEAFHIAETGRPGPVLIDIPKNIQLQRAAPVFPEEIRLRGYSTKRAAADDAVLAEVLELVAKAKKPVLYAGGGIISGQASAELCEFAERTQIPVTTTLMGIGGFPETHPLALKWLGMHGSVVANNAANEADLLLAFGVRFDDRVTGKVEKFCEHGVIVHVDIDRSEINKNKFVRLPIVADVREVLRSLNTMLAQAGYERCSEGFTRYSEWHAQIATWRGGPGKHPFSFRDASDAIQPQYAVRLLYEMTGGKALITTGVGQHQMWAGQYYDFESPRMFLTSAGLGAMGFGFPSAMGAKVARPDLEVINIDGDGSFLMNVQELACAKVERIPVKTIILNNQHLGMVVQWEDRFFAGNRGHTYLADPGAPHEIYPDYVAICAGFGIKCERVVRKEDLPAAYARMLAAQEPYLLDVMTPYTEHVLPMIPAGKTYKDIITE